MIPTNDITAWAHSAPWPSPDQVEQDLLLSQLICLIAADDYLGDELVFRGGTCLHKLYLHPARRYSEDLDYVRATAGGIGKVTRAISDIGTSLGYDVRTKMSAQPRVYLRYTAESGTTRKIKVVPSAGWKPGSGGRRVESRSTAATTRAGRSPQRRRRRQWR